MKCPRCGLVNPDTAQQCDCGYNFETKRMGAKHDKEYVKLTTGEKRRIYEEEKARLEVQEKIKTKKTSISSKPKPKQTVSLTDEKTFRLAFEGDVWIINNENIALQYEPKTSANLDQFQRNVVFILRPGTRVEIVKTKGFLDKWVYVNVCRETGEVYARGWILTDTVDKAQRIKKGAFTP